MTDLGKRRRGVRIEDDRTLPPELRDAGRLAFVAACMAWREGDPVPPMPAGVTPETLPDLIRLFAEPRVREAAVRWLAKLTPKDEPPAGSINR